MLNNHSQPSSKVVQMPLSLVVNNDTKPEENESKTESLGVQFQGLWQKAFAAIANFASSLHELAAIEQSILPSESYMASIKVLDDYKFTKMREELASDMRKRLVRHAEKHFAPIGGRLSIDESEVREKFEYNDDKPESFSLKAIWDHLEQTYGGQSGEDAAWRQTASVLIHEFSLGHQKEVVRKSGRVILELRVYLDESEKKYSGKNRLHYNCNGTVGKVLNELRAFATWSQNVALAHDLRDLCNRFWNNRHDEIVSRQQYTCGDDQEIILITYHNKFEFKLSESCAAQLQLFLGNYGNLN